MNTTIDIHDTATPRLRKLLEALVNRRPLMIGLAGEAKRTVLGHFDARQDEPNKRGWKKSGFWGTVRKRTENVTPEVTADTATLRLSAPALAMRIHGGIIAARAGKALAIPLRPEAAGISPGSGLIPGLFILRARSGKAFLAKRDDTGWRAATGQKRRRMTRTDPATTRQRLTIYYYLAKRVRHPADPRALPPTTLMRERLTGAMRDYFQDQSEK
jgi:phage gpG-like protein